MIREAIAFAAVIAASIPAATYAQPRPSGAVPPPPTAQRQDTSAAAAPAPRVEEPPPWARDRREVRDDAQAARKDWRDLKRAEALLADYDRAARARDRGALARLEEEALRLIRMEWEEGRRELDDARHELRQDRREGDDRGEWKDRRDIRREKRSQEKLTRLGETLYGLRDRFGGREVSRKRAIIADFVDMARKELWKDRRELNDDRRERHEDRYDRR